MIGIIALLIGILLPALAKARRTAQRTACAAKLEQMMIAAQTHRNDHHGYYPLAGLLPGGKPEDLNDVDCQKYDYFSFTAGGNARPLCTMVESLSAQMASSTTVNSSFGPLGVNGNASLFHLFVDSSGLIQNFICPSQGLVPDSAASMTAYQPLLYYVSYVAGTGGTVGSYTGSFGENQSYIYNEAVVGWDDPSAVTNKLRGKADKVRQPSLTMFAADGLQGNGANGRLPSNLPMSTVYIKTSLRPVTMGDAFNSRAGYAGDKQNFDLTRHNGMINVAFCDGHVESRQLTSNDLKKVYLAAP